MFVIYGQDGYVKRVVSLSDDLSIDLFLAEGEQYIEGMADPNLDKVIDGVIVKAPPQPSFAYRFNKDTFSWELAPLDQPRLDAKRRITAARNTAETNGFTAYGKVFDSDAAAIQRISVAVQAAQAVGEAFTVDWTTADNSVITLDYQQVLSLPVFMAQAANAMHIKARDLKAQIDAATTLEEINAVVW